MKRLILMRHAKSDWSDLTKPDHERVINERGRRSAEAIGRWMRSRSLHPDHILCSDAARTRATVARLSLEDTSTTLMRQLYLAEPDVMADALRSRVEDCILMVAHNPGSAMLADMLVETAPDHPSFDAYPTCATLVVDFDIENWRELRHGTGKVVEFVVPRDLIE